MVLEFICQCWTLCSGRITRPSLFLGSVVLDLILALAYPLPSSPNVTVYRQWLQLYGVERHFAKLVSQRVQSLRQLAECAEGKSLHEVMQGLGLRKRDGNAFDLLFRVLPHLLPLADASPALAPPLPMPELPLREPRHALAARARCTLPYAPQSRGVVVELRPYDSTVYPCGQWNLTAYRDLNIHLVFEQAGRKVQTASQRRMLRVHIHLEEPNMLFARLRAAAKQPQASYRAPDRMWEFLRRADDHDSGRAHHALSIDPATVAWYNSATLPPSRGLAGLPLRTLVPYFMNEDLIPPELPKVYDTVCVGSSCRWVADPSLQGRRVALACGRFCDSATTVALPSAKHAMLAFSHSKVAFVWNDMHQGTPHEAQKALQQVPWLQTHAMFTSPSLRGRRWNWTASSVAYPGSQMKSRVAQALFGRCVVLLRWLPPPFQILEEMGFEDGTHFLYVYNDTHMVATLLRVLASYAAYAHIARAGFELAMQTLTQHAFVQDYLLPVFVPHNERLTPCAARQLGPGEVSAVPHSPSGQSGK